ncbi:MAG: alcohol dehydrogenase catalytic domain-containing protein [Sphaerochaetaceae bacterium]|nr:alcohol dehydrogenase catalytic domain-containing protein [Sphaerochaetaceae bacterium]
MALKIKTIAVTGLKTIGILDLETPDLRRGEVLIKVHAAALCTLEQRIFQGEVKMPLPCTGGHEVSGEIALLGEGVNPKKWAIGNRVAVRLLYNCGECYYCRTGRTNMCERALKKPVREGLLIGPGGLCDYIIVETKDLFLIPESVSYEEAALTEPLACCVHSINRGNLQFGETIVIIGGGIMGQNHVMLAKRKGCRVIVSEVDANRRKLARQLGADITFNPLEHEPVEYVRSLTDGRGAECVFNTTSIPSVVPQAIEIAGKGGSVIQYSSMHPDAPTPISPQKLHGNEIILTGSISPNAEDFFVANRLINYGIIDMKPLIAKAFPFEEAQKAFEASIVPGTFRVIIKN